MHFRFKDKLFEDKVKITIKKRERKISPLKREKEPSVFIGKVNILSLLMSVRAVMKSNLLKKTSFCIRDHYCKVSTGTATKVLVVRKGTSGGDKAN